MKQLKIFVIVFLFSGYMYSQPGGGGGLYISNLYNARLEQLHVATDTNLAIRTFLFQGDSLVQETFIFQRMINSKNIYNSNSGFVLPPQSHYNYDSGISDDSDQRMYITYQKDTMIIDFVGIMGENGAGCVDFMDSLVIQQGYFKYSRNKVLAGDYNWGNYNENSEFLSNGLTEFSLKHLQAAAYIACNLDGFIDVSFLLEENMPASYFLRRARYYIENNQIDMSLSDISKAIAKNNGEKNCETLFLLSDAYAKNEEYDKAISYMSEAISCSRYPWSRDKGESNYRNRINLYIKANQLQKALDDYNIIVELIDYKINAINDRALFLVYYLHDYKTAIKDLYNIINSIPESDLTGCYPDVRKYASTYFNLGLAEYYDGQEDLAFQHWLKAQECGYGYSSNYSIIHFDSIIQKHAIIPELYLARALAYQRQAPYLGWGDNTKQAYLNSIVDINKAEELGLTDYRINLYRASAYQGLNEDRKALEELNITIFKNKMIPKAYAMRFNIREGLGLAKWCDKKDSDYVKSKALCKTWRFIR